MPLGLPTGKIEEIKTFERFKDLVKKQMAEQVKLGHIACLYAEQIEADYFPNPMQSLLTKDCLERQGRDAGGARINVGPSVDMIGLADLADSLAAIKRLVFEEKKFTLQELSQALEANFEGYEDCGNCLLVVPLNTAMTWMRSMAWPLR